ncbi:FAD binding domain-containing protein [Shewanella sp. D64]|uniref:FAD binding domain-containing protein n=1 Tax=unclassified Shewanella TaxID=196818 RepID=UPI0022BA1EA6|nr:MULTISPECIES: FAD binding domain-containing protein [unclassified Shewanella]MEC4727626.1 FAD binding domain-containing protein [Shewanella sp. D64]MEC4739877.1 FAD binding domain-containing protein [Shewanella sp. E94]WBJ95739.1 FAD binding domain-containing protein [Shewanella sp. MTB7]
MVKIYRPTQLTQALSYKARHDATLFAGGTDIMVRGLENRIDSDAPVLFLDDIAGLKTIKLMNLGVESKVIIGAGVTLQELIAHESVPFMVKDAAKRIGAPALRNRATLIGNVCNASPAADMLPVLYLLNAHVDLASEQGSRQLPIEAFILGPGKTALNADEIVISVSLTLPWFDDYFYHKVGTRAANALTKLSILAAVRVESGIIMDWRLTFGAVGPTVVRSVEFENSLIGRKATTLTTDKIRNEILDHYNNQISPIDDRRSSAEYRRCAAMNLLRRWIYQFH